MFHRSSCLIIYTAQILMSVRWQITPVMRMQSALTQMEGLSVCVKLDSLEMELIAMVWHYDTGIYDICIK